MIELKVKAPAKINFTLEILNKRKDGFHNIQSIMQAINLYDFLTFKISENPINEIILNGNSKIIPYNEKNLVYKAINEYFAKSEIFNKKIEVYIEKNIPIEAGLAGGSTDAAATFFALNEIFKKLNEQELNELMAKQGSDLNFCYYGSTALCEGRGEILNKLPFIASEISLIKPRNLGISAAYAYKKYSLLQPKIFSDYTHKLINNLPKIKSENLYNDLETAIINDFEELKLIKQKLPNSTMSGSGSTFFVLNGVVNAMFPENFQLIEGLQTINSGVEIC